MTAPRIPARRRLAVAAACLAVALTGCVQSGRTSHPDNFAGDVACPVEPDPSITTTARIAWRRVNPSEHVHMRLLLPIC